MSEKKALFYGQDGQPLNPVAILGLTRLYGIGDDGAVSANDIGMDFDKFLHPALKEVPRAMTLGALDVGTRKPLQLSPGAGCVLGQPDSGKSLLANTLRARNEEMVTVIRYREPEDDSLLNEANLIHELNVALASQKQVIFVDSLRTTFYTSTGTTGKGGVNMGIFALLTAYDILARRAGKVLLFSLNPMTNDADAILFYLDAARGSVSHTFHATEPKKFRLSSRSLETRGWVDLSYFPKKADTEERRAEAVRPITAPSISDDTIVDLYTTTLR